MGVSRSTFQRIIFAPGQVALALSRTGTPGRACPLTCAPSSAPAAALLALACSRLPDSYLAGSGIIAYPETASPWIRLAPRSFDGGQYRDIV